MERKNIVDGVERVVGIDAISSSLFIREEKLHTVRTNFS